MISASIKALLGEELANQVEAALKAKGKGGADIDLVVGNDGSHVASETHAAEKTRADASEKLLQSVADALKELGASGDTKTLAADVQKVKGDVAGMQTAHSAEMAKLLKTTALKLGLGGSVHDPDDIISRLELDKIELDDAGKLKGNLDELVKPIKEAKPYLFKEPPAQGLQLSGAVPRQSGGAPAEASTQAIDAAFGLAEGGK